MGQTAGGSIFNIATGEITYATNDEMLDDAYFMDEIYDREVISGSGGGIGDGTTGGDSNTGGTINPANPNDPDINYSNGDYMYPNDSTYITDLHTQWEEGNNGRIYELSTCVPHAIVTAMQILEYKKRGIRYQFSHGWIWGNRESFIYADNKNSETGMVTIDVLNAMKNIGVCLYDTLPNCWLYKKESEPIIYPTTDWDTNPSPNLEEYTAVQNIYTATLNECSHFRFSSWSSVGNTNIATMKAYITQYGCGSLTVNDTKEMWNAETNDGIVVYNEATITNGYGHEMCVRGWKTIADKEYWICQNSWKTSWGGLLGHYGFFFIPMDYPRISGLFTLTPTLPTNSFAWSNPIVAGNTTGLLANDWDTLCDNIMGKLKWKGLSHSTTIPYVEKGDILTATLFNSINGNIGQMINTGISTKAIKDTLLASDFNNLVTKYNAI